MTTVSTRSFYDRAALDISGLRRRTEDLRSAVGSDSRLSRSSDDPVAASKLRGLSRDTVLSRIDSANANRATAGLALADDTLSAVSDMIIHAQELATQAASGTLTVSQRAAIGNELGQLHGSLVALANARDGEGHALFGGETAGPAYIVDAAGNAAYAGTPSPADVDLGGGQTVPRGVAGPAAFGFAATDLFAVVKGLADALRAGGADPASAARTALDGLGQGLNTVNTAQTVVGARLASIELVGDRRVQTDEARGAEAADLGGVDIGATLIRLQQATTVLEASQASFARLSSLSLFDALR